MRNSAVLVAVVLCAAAACSSSSGSPVAAISSGPPPGPPADGGTYPSAAAILKALQDGGAACTLPQPVAHPTLAGALSMTDCDALGGQSDTVAVVFDTRAHAVAYATAITSADSGMMFSPGNVVVYGRNWAVNTTSAYAPRAKLVLGGQEMAAPAPSAT